jgi:methylglutaconyl-CoA hydratase
LITIPILEVKRQQAVAYVILNRPEVRNAFNAALIGDITEAFSMLGVDDSVRVIVLAARGIAFCAGADLAWMQQMSTYTLAENRADAARLARMLYTIYQCPKPVVAKVQGDCYAGGMGLIAACDIAVAVDTAHFCLSEVKLGLIPATIAPYVIDAMGTRAARRYFLTGERFSAPEAYRLGVVHALASAATLDGVVGQIVDALVSAGPQAVRSAKRLVCDIADKPLDAVLIADTVERIAMIRASDEGKEGVQAFLEKRKPGWIV